MRILTALMLAATVSGCMSMNTPDRFLITHMRRGEVHAVASDESRLLVRTFPNDHDGDLAFWSDTLRNEFVENRGYTLLEEREVEAKAGKSSREYVFEVAMGGSTWRYLLAVTIVDGLLKSHVRCAEFVADKSHFDEHVGNVRESIASLRG